MITTEHLNFILKTFSIDQKTLAKTLNVAPFTITRWMSGESVPSGLQEEVLKGLYNAAVEVSKKNVDEQKAMGALITLGIGALLFYLLTKPR